MKIVLFADSIYKCHQQLAYYLFLWPDDPIISEYHNCDNCKEQEQDNPDICDISIEILWLIRIMNALLQHAIIQNNNIHYVTRDDVIDVFYENKNSNVTRKNLI